LNLSRRSHRFTKPALTSAFDKEVPLARGEEKDPGKSFD
jgi:hypothetical protein